MRDDIRDQLHEVNKMRARLPKVRATIEAITGARTGDDVIPDEILASIFHRCAQIVAVAIGDQRDTYTAAEVRGVALAAATAAAGEQFTMVRAVLTEPQFQALADKSGPQSDAEVKKRLGISDDPGIREGRYL